MALIHDLLPACAVTVEGGDESARLLPGEELGVARMAEKRRREFVAGRSCARAALARLGWHGFPVLAGPGRMPLWPPGIVGSITHCEGYCACTVARASELRTVGIDAELNVPLPAGALEVVCTERERASLPRLPGVHWPTLVFSEKEAVYKAWYPIARCWLDHLDADISLHADRGAFVARLRAAPHDLIRFPGHRLEGRFRVTPRYLLTAVALAP